MNVVIKVDEYDMDDNYRPNILAPSELRNSDGFNSFNQMSSSVRNFVNTYGIAVHQKQPVQQSGQFERTVSTGMFTSNRKNIVGG